MGSANYWAGSCPCDQMVPTKAASATFELDRSAVAKARAMPDAGSTGTVEISEDGRTAPGGLTVFL